MCKSEEPNIAAIDIYQHTVDEVSQSKDAKIKLESSVSLDDSSATNATLSGDSVSDAIPSDWKTTTNEVYESPDAYKIPHDQLFAQVPGRLSLLSNVVKYKVSIRSLSVYSNAILF